MKVLIGNSVTDYLRKAHNQNKHFRHVCQGWAILEDFIAIPILGGQNCREIIEISNFLKKTLETLIEYLKKLGLSCAKLRIS